MKLRNLGTSGLKISLVGIGCNNFGGRIDDAASTDVLNKAIELGITLFDTADSYGKDCGSEIFLGNTLGPRRKDIVLASKFGLPLDKAGIKSGASRRYIMNAVEASLTRLKTDYLDLYQLHRPDPQTPIEETLRALDDLVRQGKVRYIGCSNLAGWQVATAQWTSKTLNLDSFVSCQDEYSLLVRDIEKDAVPAMQHYGLGLLPFFPLASGLLTGKYKRNAAAPAGSRFANVPHLKARFMTEKGLLVVEQLEAFAKSRGHSMLELAMSWLACRPQVSSVIAGATSAEQVVQNAKSVDWVLTAEDMAEVDKITKGA